MKISKALWLSVLVAFLGSASCLFAGEEGSVLISRIWWIAPVASLLALGFAAFFYTRMMKASEGTDKMKEIARHVREGAYAYLYSQYKVVGIVFVVLFVVFALLAKAGIQNPFVPVAFLTGGFFSGLCGFLGMKTATNASTGRRRIRPAGHLCLVPDPRQARLHDAEHGRRPAFPRPDPGSRRYDQCREVR